jgi:hypothetical protein
MARKNWKPGRNWKAGSTYSAITYPADPEDSSAILKFGQGR